MRRLGLLVALLAGLAGTPASATAAPGTIAFTEGGALRVVRDDGTRARTLLPSAARAADPAVSPDGRLVAASVLDRDGVPAIAVLRADGRGGRVIGPGLRSGVSRLAAWRAPAWTPSGRLLAACLPSPGRGWEVCSLDTHGRRARPLTRCGCMTAAGGSPELDVAPDGRTIIFQAYDRLRTVSIAGGRPATLARAAGATPFSHPSVAPDGRRLAVALGDRVVIRPLAGGPAAELPGSWRSPAFGPRGERLAVLSTTPGSRGVWTLAGDGSDPRLVLAAAVDEFDRLDWSAG
jgi:Tol biopolymer transport system component